MLIRHDHAGAPADLAFTEAMVRDARFSTAYRESGDIADMRAATERLLTLPFVRPVDPAVRPQPARLGSVTGEWLRPADARRPGTLVFFHGGGYVRGSLALGRSNAADLAIASGLPCFSVAYRQAPEHRFPAAVDDAVEACRILATQAGTGPLLLAGESAGGAIAIATALRLRDLGIARPAGVAAISGFFDLTQSGASWAANGERDLATPAMARRLADMYCADADRRDPLASPLFARFDGLPPLHVTVGGHEVLLSEAESLARDAAAAGVDVTLEVFEGMPHGFIKYRLEAAALALRRVGQWLAQRADDGAGAA